MAADVKPASYCMYLRGYSDDGHLSKGIYSGDQLTQRLDAAASDDAIPYLRNDLPEPYDDTCVCMPSIFAVSSVPVARPDSYPITLRSEENVLCEAETEPCDSTVILRGRNATSIGGDVYYDFVFGGDVTYGLEVHYPRQRIKFEVRQIPFEECFVVRQIPIEEPFEVRQLPIEELFEVRSY
eukprot:5786746-Amphidinium_carterae.1